MESCTKIPPDAHELLAVDLELWGCASEFRTQGFCRCPLGHKINPFLITVPQDSAGPSPSTRCRQRTGSWCQSVPRGLGAPREDWVYVRFTGTASCWLQVLRECWAGFSPSLLWSTAAWSRQIWNCPLTYHQECSLLEAFT